jgi:hypothetical protein
MVIYATAISYLWHLAKPMAGIMLIVSTSMIGLARAQDKLPQLPVSVLGGSSIVRFDNDWFGNVNNPLTCRTVTIKSTADALKAVEFSSVGVGKVSFYSGGFATCPTSDPAWTESLDVPLQIGHPQSVSMRFSSEELLAPGISLQGKIMIWADHYQRIELPIKLERLGQPSYLKSLGWFVGVLVPSVIGFLIGLATNYLKSRYDDATAFAKYRYTNHAVLDTFFNNHYQEYKKGRPADFCSSVFNKMMVEDIMLNLPTVTQKEVLKKARHSDRDGLIWTLKRLFPEWSELI